MTDYFLSRRQLARALVAMVSTVFLQPGASFAFPYNSQLENPELLTGSSKVSRLEDLDGIFGAGRTQKLTKQPWSSTNWPIYQGIAAWRYADPSFLSGFGEFESNSTFLLQHLGDNGGLPDDYRDFSPAEKYDLLVGDDHYSFSRAMLAVGADLKQRWGSVAKWQGVCHGWSAAALKMDRPQRSVLMASPEGKKILFYPDDIKALASLLWANASYKTRMIGSRCDWTNPTLNLTTRSDGSANGSLAGDYENLDCRNINPAAFHLGVYQQIASGEGVIMDGAWDSEVLNYPIVGFTYKYFNPRNAIELNLRPSARKLVSSEQTQVKALDTFSEAKVDLWRFPEDPFRNFRSKKAKSIVGVEMFLTYADNTQPEPSETDSSARDLVTTVRYVYDIELDENGVPVGGEWYQKQRPDFLWMPDKNYQAKSYGDSYISSYGVTAASKMSARHGQPLAKIVNQLIQESNR